MSIRLYADALRVVIYEEAPGGGDATDPASLMNRPVVNPMGWLANVYFHSDFDYYGTVINQTVAVAHAAVAGQTQQITFLTSFEGRYAYADHLLVQHNLGYVPRFFAVYDGKMIPHGMPVQREDVGRARFVTAYATTTQIRLWELAWASATTLNAITLNYGVMVFANSAANPLLDMLMIQPGDVVFGQGRFNMNWPHLRVVASGESPFAQALQRTAAIANGGLRVYPPNGGALDFGPYTNINGGLSAPAFITAQAGR